MSGALQAALPTGRRRKSFCSFSQALAGNPRARGPALLLSASQLHAPAGREAVAQPEQPRNGRREQEAGADFV